MRAILAWLRELIGRFTRTLDPWLLLPLAGLMLIGLLVLYSAGNMTPGLAIRQGARYALGCGALWALSRVPLARLRDTAPIVFAASLLPLLLVLAIGTGKHGRHWIDLGVFYFQPAEVLKISLPMMVAWHLSRKPLPPRIRDVLASLSIIGIPTGLILLQPDFGSAMLVASAGMFALYLAGLPWWWFAAGLASVAAIAPAAWFWWLRPYQKDRVLTFLDPESDPLGTGWNIIQSRIAIGSGHWTGKGWGKGTQSHLDYLPEHTTDFIFAVFAEEFGWIGVVTVLLLYLWLIARCLWVAGQSRDGFARLLAGAMGLALFVYVIVNGGMIAGLLPVVGVPMPLLSYGGTAAVSLLAGMGVVMAVHAHNQQRRR